MIAETIEHIADRVLAYEETDLTALLNHFKTRMEQFEPGPAWERAVIAYFLINGVRVKNALKQGKMNSQELTPGRRPATRAVGTSIVACGAPQHLLWWSRPQHGGLKSRPWRRIHHGVDGYLSVAGMPGLSTARHPPRPR